MRGTLLWTFHFVFRTPEAEARALLPKSLEPVSVGGRAFYNVAIGEFEAVRGASNPFRVGQKGHLVSYRLYARRPGSETIGLFPLRTECDAPKLLERVGHLAGTIATPCHVDVFDDTFGTVQITVEESEAPLDVTLDTRGKPVKGAGSPFHALSEAAMLLRPPTTLWSPEGEAIDIGRVEGKWAGRLVRVPQSQWSYFDGKTAEFELCFDVPLLHYLWPEGCTLAP